MKNPRFRIRFLIFMTAAGILLAGCAALTAFMSPVQRAARYSEVEVFWRDNWPFSRARFFPLRFAPVLDRMGIIAPVRVHVEPGINLLLDPLDIVGRTLLAKGRWEPGTWGMIRSRLRPGHTFIDVGAHIGYYSLKAAQETGHGGRVVAVEPNPDTARQLRDNILHSGASGIAVEEVACADRESTIQLFASHRGNTGRSSLSAANAAMHSDAKPTMCTVRARPLDDIVAELRLPRVDVIKCDVEGAEVLVLKGAKETLARFRPTLVLEVLDYQLRQMNTSEAELAGLLSRAGYVRGRQADENIEWIPQEQLSMGAIQAR
jgi:FkbM family methyltransferase